MIGSTSMLVRAMCAPPMLARVKQQAGDRGAERGDSQRKQGGPCSSYRRGLAQELLQIERLDRSLGPGCRVAVDILEQPCKRSCIVDIVDHDGNSRSSSPSAAARLRVASATVSVGPPGDVGDEAGMECAHAEEVVAAIIATAEYHAPVVSFQEQVSRLHQSRGREGRRVGAQHAGGSMAPREQLLRRVQQAAAEIPLPPAGPARCRRRAHSASPARDEAEAPLAPSGA